MNRFIGCDLDAAKFILTDLAKFHAIPLAIKLLKSHIFDIRIKKYMECFNPIEKKPGDGSSPNNLTDILSENKTCDALVPFLKKSFTLAEKDRDSFREPFATLSHKDMWINNFMVKLEKGKIVKNKFVDFQGFTYQSPVRDLLFYLFTSVQIHVLKEHLDYLLMFYHDQFIKTLKELHCPIGDFSFDKFMDEIRCFGIYEISHIILMTVVVVFGRKYEPADNEQGFEHPPLYTKDDMPLELKERIWWVLQEFGKRNWLSS